MSTDSGAAFKAPLQVKYEVSMKPEDYGNVGETSDSTGTILLIDDEPGVLDMMA